MSFLLRSARALAFGLIWLAAAAFAPSYDAAAAEHVIHVSVDGLNPHWMQQVIDAGRAPTFARLEAEGAWTTNARTDYSYTITLPNHTCMITGLPVEQAAAFPVGRFHGWTINDVPQKGATLHNTGNPAAKYIASTFDVAHDAGLSTALYTTKDKFVIYDQSYNATTGAANAHGRDKIDTFFFQDDGPPNYSDGMNHRFLSDLAANHFNYAFVHYRDCDSAGHGFGWGSPEYLQAVASVDRCLADVLKLVESDPELNCKTTIILTADHGGVGTNHAESDMSVNYTIPVFVWGAGTCRGDLYAFNSGTRTEPGESRPEYGFDHQPIRNGDTGNLALKLLGLGPIPGSVINPKQDLRIASPADFNRDGNVDAADDTIWRDTQGSTTDLRAD
ncbi:MAG: alkaline phosphatase family protein, partial [Pirellulales bacterium]